MAKRILFCRHGESTANRDGIVAGQTDVPLTEKGKDEARTLNRKLADERFDEIITSDLRRAFDTAFAIADRRVLRKFEPTKLLREVNFGDAEGKPKVYGEASALARLGRGELSGAETLVQLDSRAKAAWQLLRHGPPDGTACVVGHDTFTAIMVAVHEGVPPEGFVEYRKSFELGNCEVREVLI